MNIRRNRDNLPPIKERKTTPSLASYTGPVLYIDRPDNKTAPVEAWGDALAFSGCEVQDEYK